MAETGGVGVGLEPATDDPAHLPVIRAMRRVVHVVVVAGLVDAAVGTGGSTFIYPFPVALVNLCVG